MTDELIGKLVGGYEILNQIGQGGMATVYRAQQISMNRIVALKMLPRQFLNDDTYLQRFEREVKIVSQLEHRSIVPVHDYGQYNGQPYIVMRYMPAGSVDDLLQHGPLSLERTHHIVEQIAPALDYAHSKNVLHRDLKPSNVLMDDGGGAFLTDFGIARIIGEQGPGITTQGVVGTPSYMSPEQAQAHPLDGRSDLYSLGVMLFEMLTGRRPFESDTPYSIAVMQVTTPPPSPRTFNPVIPYAVEQVILKSLKKDRDERYPTAVALAEALHEAIEHPDKKHDTQPRPNPEIRAAVQAQVNSLPPAAPLSPLSSAPVSPPPQQPYVGGYPTGTSPSMSLRPASVGSRLRKRRNGMPWMNIAVGGLIGCALLTIVVIVIALVINKVTSSAEGGSPTATLTKTQSDATHDSLTATVPNLDPTSAAARRTLLPSTPAPTVSPTQPPLSAARGEVVYFDELPDNKGYEILTLDLQTKNINQLTSDSGTNSYPMASPDGKLVAYQSSRDGDFDIYVMNPLGGELIKITYNDWLDRTPSWGPDSEWIIFSSDTRGDGNYDLYRVRPNGSNLELVYSNGDRNSNPRWSPDNRHIVFTTGKANNANTWEIAQLDIVTNKMTLLTNNNIKDWSPSYSPDGKSILYVVPGQGNAAIALMNSDGSGSHVLYDGSGYEWGANFSPDGNYIVFNSDATGHDELYLMTADGKQVEQLTTAGGLYASWIPK
jgi:serine/threonine-protein kinase